MLEKAVGFKPGKGGMWKSCISIKKDVQEENAEKFLKSPQEEQPRIVIFNKNGENEVANIVGDGIVVNLTETSLHYALIVLVCCFYIYDLAYPRKYCQFLGLIQHIVLEDKYLDTKSAGFLSFLNKLKEAKKIFKV